MAGDDVTGDDVNLVQLAAELAAAHRWRQPPGLSYGPDGLTVHRKGVDPAKVAAVLAAHVPDPEFGVDPAELARQEARTRLRDLNAKGWANLTDAERDEVQQHTLTLLAGL